MSIYLVHPKTKNPDSMLTLAVAGFVFSGIIVAATMIYTFVTGQSLDGMSSVATLVAAILSPSLGAYTIRKYTDAKHISDKEDT